MPISKHSTRLLVLSEIQLHFIQTKDWLIDSKLSDDEILSALHELMQEEHEKVRELINNVDSN